MSLTNIDKIIKKDDWAKCEPGTHIFPDFSPGMKYDKGKVRWDLVPLDSTEGVARVLTFGAAKYSDNSWQQLENGKARYFAALMRHYKAMIDGEELDSESGLPHADHFLTNAYFITWLMKQKIRRELTNNES